MSHSNWPRVLLFDLAHKQCNGIIEGWLHCLTSESKVRFLFNDILFGSRWCLVIAEIQFSLIKKNKNWTSRTLANLPTPLCPIKSHIPVNTFSQIHLKYKNYPLRAMFSNASRADVHFGFSRPLFACPIGRAILLWVWWIKFVQPCRYLFIFLDHFLILFQYFFLLIKFSIFKSTILILWQQ